jgi:hypothetical protein
MMTDNIEDYKYVLGQDPGVTTGIAMVRYTDDTAPELVYLTQLPKGIKGFFDFFEGSQPTENVTIVSESFVNRPGIKSPDVTPLRIEGVQYTLWGDEVVYQTPDMKSLVPDQVLKDNNLWTPGKRHQMDALIHVLVYLRNEGHQPTLKALSGESDALAEKGEAQEKSLPSAAELAEKMSATGVSVEEAAEAIQRLMQAFSEMYNGGEPVREDPPEQEEQQQQEGQGGGEAGEGEAESEPTGTGGAGQEFEVDEPDPEGERRKRRLNGSFIGFDED